jgi:hypothetical protein
MSFYLFIILVLVIFLIAFAIMKRENVRASFTFKPFGFTLEAKNEHQPLPAAGTSAAEPGK